MKKHFPLNFYFNQKESIWKLILQQKWSGCTMVCRVKQSDICRRSTTLLVVNNAGSHFRVCTEFLTDGKC